ncbi:MAG TPA: indole-3-glycerol phosphate synthase TrpC [Clostridiales bacterium]|nr:indole-3-glycerol phosphate synthase TrpC [Clostridiales bacterium]
MILDRIVEKTKIRVKTAKLSLPINELIKSLELNKELFFIFEKTLKNDRINFICEVKKASPSKGVISKDFNPVKIAKEYKEAGADCISVLTEPDFFLGHNDYLKEIKNKVNIPILRKDFIIDSYQIYESKLIGADCILLICSILTDQELKGFIEIADKLGLSTLVEAHDEEEINRAIKAGARMIGVNNRNLKTFEVDINNSLNLRKMVANGIIYISESGIRDEADIKRCIDANVNAVLIGETLMKASNKKEMLGRLKNG